MKLDGKFRGRIIKNKDSSEVPDDQWVLFLAKDNAFPATLDFYYQECVRLGAAREQLDAVQGLIDRVADWRSKNPHLCKVPDIQVGEINV